MADAAGNGTSLISKEKFEEMRNALDKDGDGSVDKSEFMEAWTKLFPDMTAEEKETTWTKMDADKSGTLEVAELAQFFGFNWEGEAATEMTDDQILEALQMQAKLAELEMSKNKPKAAEEEKAPKEPKEQARDPTIKIVNLEKKGSGDPEEETLREMLTCAALGDLVKVPDVEENLEKYIEMKVNFRCEDEKGEMPLHKLARLKVTDSNKTAFKRCYTAIIHLMREQAATAGKKIMKPGEGAIVTDINHQDKAGKTPLYMAVEHKNLEMIDRLFDLKVDGPDSILVNSVGWTVMHAAVNTDDLEVTKALVKHFTPARTKLLLQTPDKTGREPLHIAAYKCTEEMVTYLIDLGASNKKTDSAGNNAAKLADRAGRRKSREIIEERLDGAALAAAAK